MKNTAQVASGIPLAATCYASSGAFASGQGSASVGNSVEPKALQVFLQAEPAEVPAGK